MRLRLAIPAALLLAVGGIAIAQNAAEQRLQEAVARLRAELPTGATLTYESATVEPASDRVRLRNLAFAIDQNRVVAEEVVIEGIAAAGAGFARLSARNLSFQESGSPVGRIESVTAGGVAFSPVGQAFDMAQFRADLLEVAGVSLAPSSGERISLGRYRLTELGQGRASGVVLEELRFTMPGTPVVDHVSLGRLSGTGVPLFDVIAAVSAGQMPKTSQQTGRSDLSIEALRLTGGGREVARVARITGESDDVPGRAGVKTSRFAITGAAIEIPPEVQPMLQGLGYTRLAFGFDVDGDVDEAGGAFDLRRMRLAVEQAGTIDLAARISGIGPGMTDFDAAQLDAMTLLYADDGLIARSFRAMAARTGQPEQTLRGQAEQQIHTVFNAKPGAGHPIADPLVRLIRQGGTFILEARPPRPISVADAQDRNMSPARAIELLGLSATHR